MFINYLHMLRRFNRDVRLYLFATALLGFVVFGGIYPVLFNLYLLRLGYGPEFVGTINSVGMLTFALCSLPVGIVSSRWGAHRTMILGLGLVVGAFILLPLGEFLPSIRSAWLFVCIFLRAIGFALYWVNARPFLMSVTDLGERDHVYSVQAAVSPLAGFAGSLIAGLMPEFFAAALDMPLDHPAVYRYPLWIAAFLLIPAWIAIASLSEFKVEHPPERGLPGSSLPLVLFSLLSVAVLLQASGMGVVRSFFTVYLDDGLHVSPSRIGFLSAIAQLVGAAAALSTPVLAARWGNGRVFFLASLGAVTGLLPLAFIPHWIAAGLGFLGVVSLMSVTIPALNVYQMELVSPRWRTAMSGTTAMANGLGWSATSFLGGQIVASLGYRPLFLSSAALTLVGSLLFWSYFRVPRGELANDLDGITPGDAK